MAWHQRSVNKAFLQGVLDESRGGREDSRRSTERTSPLKYDPLDQMNPKLARGASRHLKRTPVSIRVQVLPHSFQAAPFSRNRPEFRPWMPSRNDPRGERMLSLH